MKDKLDKQIMKEYFGLGVKTYSLLETQQSLK